MRGVDRRGHVQQEGLHGALVVRGGPTGIAVPPTNKVRTHVLLIRRHLWGQRAGIGRGIKFGDTSINRRPKNN